MMGEPLDELRDLTRTLASTRDELGEYRTETRVLAAKMDAVLDRLTERDLELTKRVDEQGSHLGQRVEKLEQKWDRVYAAVAIASIGSGSVAAAVAQALAAAAGVSP